MNKSEIRNEIETIAKDSGYPPGCGTELLEVFLDIISDALARGEEVRISNFGKFTPRDRPKVSRRNPRTQEEIEVAARRGILFRPSPALRDRVNGNEH